MSGKTDAFEPVGSLNVYLESDHWDLPAGPCLVGSDLRVPGCKQFKEYHALGTLDKDGSSPGGRGSGFAVTPIPSAEAISATSSRWIVPYPPPKATLSPGGGGWSPATRQFDR